MKKNPKHNKKNTLERKIKDYRRILKDDEDWDWYYILKLLCYKLERTRKCIITNNVILDAKKVGDQIKKVEELLHRVAENKYYDEISKDFRKKYGRPQMIYEKSTENNDSRIVHMKYAKETPRNSKQIQKENLKLQNRAEKMQKNDLKKAFELMQRDIWGWWD